MHILLNTHEDNHYTIPDAMDGELLNLEKTGGRSFLNEYK